MIPLSKGETIAVFASIVIMAVALAMVRFNTDTFSRADSMPSMQTAAVVVAGDDSTAVEDIKESVSLSGELTKLVVDDVKRGVGREVAEGDTVSVHYVGTLRDGSEFDSSLKRGEPFSFTVGEGRVIEGWEEGLLGMQVGGERILVVPPEMAYGNRQVGPIPPNSPLIFKIELLNIE